MPEFTEKSRKAFGWAARDNSGLLSPFQFSRREPGSKDVVFKVLYCGICHTDYHLAKNEWGVSKYPFVPGHECVGTVIESGVEAKKFKVGDRVGLGYVSGSCRSCSSCSGDLENYCSEHRATVNSNGGFSDVMVADEHFLVRIPDALPLDAAAPLLCAGVTVFSPLSHFGLVKPGMNIAVVGLGGLGHVAVKFAKAFGARVTVVSTSSSKRDDAIGRLGADAFLVSGDQDEMKGAMGMMDGILDTVSVVHSLVSLIGLLKPDGKLIMIGAPAKPLELPIFPLLMGRKVIAGSYIGGMKELQEMIDFAVEHDIKADIELVAMDYVNTAMERLVNGDVRYRFVIDIANSLQSHI